MMRLPDGIAALPSYPKDPALDEPRFKVGEVATAIGIDVGLLKSWIDGPPRIFFLGPYDQHGAGPGRSRLLTLRRAIAAGATAELVNLGIVPRRACLISALLLDISVPRAKQPGNAGLDLVLVVASDGEASTGTTDQLAEVLSGHGRNGASLFVSLAAVSQRVRNGLFKLGHRVGPVG